MSAFLFVATGVLLLGFGMAGLRGGAGPAWLNYLALVGALLGIVGGASPTAVGDGSPILYLAVISFLILAVFVIVTAVEMLRSPEAAVEGV